MMVINSDQPRPNSSSFPKWRPDAAILENEKTLGTRLGESPRYLPGGEGGSTASYRLYRYVPL